MLFCLAEQGANDILVPYLPDVGNNAGGPLGRQTEIDREERLTRRPQRRFETVLRDLETMTPCGSTG
jgi:hypothetical protein